MTKEKFLLSLRDKLLDFPQDEAEERLNFYQEMIEDRMEEGLSEEDAVAAVGSVDEIAAQVTSEFPEIPGKPQKVKTKRRMKAWEVVFLVLGAPIWVSLLIAALTVLISLLAALWSVIVSLWAVFASLVGCGFAGIAAGSVLAVAADKYTGVAMMGAGLACIGLSILFFFGCKGATKGSAWLTKRLAMWTAKCFRQKEEV